MGPLTRANEELPYYDRRAPGARDLIAQALTVCHDALSSELEANDGKVDEKPVDSWSRPVVAFAVFASQHDVPPERALAAFKKMVSELRPVERLAINERNEMVRRLVH